MKEITNPSYILSVNVTIPEGLTARRIAGLLKAKIGIDSAKFIKLVNDPNFAKQLGINANNLEGYLMPDTYIFIWGDAEENVIAKMVSEFKKFYDDTLKEREKVVGLNTHQVVTLASIVEGEARFEDEKPRIAGVYFNRLRRKMPLEADPTIQYIIPDGPRRLFYKDLKIESPYNTYLNPGLPPGPVNNPSRSSILAVLYPEKNKFLYFVSDGSGRHIFSKTYEEHLKAVRRYRKILAERKNQEKIFNESK
ncbi:MAG: endolytic transglycosylase MltG [Candidatus Kryptonium sp.]